MKKIITLLYIIFLTLDMVAQNVGIGTSAPVFKLDVRNGSINTDSVYRINFNTVLSIPSVNNLFIGRNVGLVNTGNFNTFCGINAGLRNTEGFDNSFFGAGAGGFTTTGNSNSFFGTFAGDNNTTGINNSFFGKSTGTNNNSGSNNSFFGRNAGGHNTIGDDNCFFGFGAGQFNRTGGGNVAIGSHALNLNEESSGVIAIGDSAMKNFTFGGRNIAIGALAMHRFTAGSENTAVGRHAMRASDEGSQNTAIGEGSLLTCDDCNLNTGIGVNSMGSPGPFSLTGDENTALGAHTFMEFTSIFNATIVGARANGTASNQVRLGNSAVTSIGGFVGWSVISDGRYKQNVQQNVPGIEFIMQLQPVTYALLAQNLDNLRKKGPTEENSPAYLKALNEKSTIRYSGFIAQDVEAAARKLNFDFSGVDAPKNANDLYSLRYAEFVVPMVKAIQEQQALIKSQQQQIDELKVLVNDLKKRIQ